MKAIITIVIITLSVMITQAQSLLGNKPSNYIEDSLYVISDTMTCNETVTASIVESNRRYTYTINKFYDTYTFQQINNERLYYNWKATSFIIHFVGAQTAMIFHNAIQKDKVLHLIAGDIISSGSYLVLHKLKVKHPLIGSIIIGTIAGTAKEWIYDGEMHKSTPSFKDGLWTAIGAANGGIRTHALLFKVQIPIK